MVQLTKGFAISHDINNNAMKQEDGQVSVFGPPETFLCPCTKGVMVILRPTPFVR
jgi:hypothetical protein